MRLRGRVAIVTGAGRGIGRAIALALAREGAELALASRTLPELDSVVADLHAMGSRALAIRTDVSQWAAVKHLATTALNGLGRIDILVNCAGLQKPIGPLWTNAPNVWLRTLQVNVGGTFLCCKAVIPIMARQGAGKIVNLSGGGGTAPRPFFSAYAASKAAVIRLTETLAHEVEDLNIQVNAIAPGIVATRMVEEVVAAGSLAGDKALAEARQALNARNSPASAAALAVFLASPESGGLTGRLISAVWDDWHTLPGRVDEINKTELYTLRRVEARHPPGE